MAIVYQLINFIILFGLLGWFCRKMIKNMFAGRRDQINKDLEGAEQAKENAAALADELTKGVEEATAQKAEIAADAQKRAAEDRADMVGDSTAQAEKILARARAEEDKQRNAMLDEISTRTLVSVTEQTRAALAGEENADAVKALNMQGLNSVVGKIELTAMDKLAIANGEDLGVIIGSSKALAEDELSAMAEVLEKNLGTKVALENKVDAGHVGGIRVQIGDTVYDSTLGNQLDKFQTEVEAKHFMADSMEAMVAEIERQLEGFDQNIDVYQVGEIINLGDGICRVGGLSDCMAGEMLAFPGGLFGMVQDLNAENVGVVLMGPYGHIKVGDEVRRTYRIIEVPVGEAMIGRVVNSMGQPVDGNGPIETEHRRAIESPAPGVIKRKSVSVPLQTGLKAIDALVPIGRGQRELIIGDRQTGKTAIAMDTILNQKDSGVICIYVAIGQKESTVATFVEKLRQEGAMDYTIVVSANASEPAPMLYIAPYAGCAMGEYFMYQGKDVLIIYDDLTKQANAYRELSLLLQRPPGREAYPGDVFYLHSRLLERAARLAPEFGGGSMTALPIIETQAGDISAYIPTNVISITDGQIFLETDLFHSGVRPAINVGLSVSRVGGAAQVPAMKQFAGRLRMELAQYRELASFAQFGSDLDKATRDALLRGEHMTELLKQKQYKPLSVVDQVIIIFAGNEGFTDGIALDKMADYEAQLVPYVRSNCGDIVEAIVSRKKLSKDQIAELKACMETFGKTFA